MKLAEWARANGLHPQTAYTWVREDRMPVPFRRLPSGTILVDAPSPVAGTERVVVYARVSSHDQRADLDRQVARVSEWATSHGREVGEVVCEVGSGLNGKRPRLRRILSDPSATVVVVEHRDRLARFGVEHLEAALAAQGRRIVVVGPGETTDDVVRDMIEVLTSMRPPVRPARRAEPCHAGGHRDQARSGPGCAVTSVVQAYQFALDPTPAQERQLRSHCGAQRYAFNWGLALVKANLAQREAERSYGIPDDELTPSLNWSAYSFRKLWNQVKDDAAPWWPENSKEAYSSGLANLSTAPTPATSADSR